MVLHQLKKMRITHDGKVGIGTTSPSNKLTVEDTIGIKRSGVAAITTLQMAGSGLIVNGHSGYHPLIIQANSTEVAWFKNDGKVGIGTSNPQEILDVSGSEPSIRIGDSSANKHFNMKVASGGGVSKLRFNSETSDNVLVVQNNERVGINNSVEHTIWMYLLIVEMWKLDYTEMRM